MAKRIPKSPGKLTQVAKSYNFAHTQMTRDQLVSTSVGWPKGEKLASTCAELRTNTVREITAYSANRR